MSDRAIEVLDIQGPNLIPCEYLDETGSVIKVDLEWLDILSGQLEKARAHQH